MEGGRGWHGQASNVTSGVRVKILPSVDSRKTYCLALHAGPGSLGPPTWVPGRKPAEPTTRLSIRTRAPTLKHPPRSPHFQVRAHSGPTPGTPPHLVQWTESENSSKCGQQKAALPGPPRGPREPGEPPTWVPGRKPAEPTTRLSIRSSFCSCCFDPHLLCIVPVSVPVPVGLLAIFSVSFQTLFLLDFSQSPLYRSSFCSCCFAPNLLYIVPVSVPVVLLPSFSSCCLAPNALRIVPVSVPVGLLAVFSVSFQFQFLTLSQGSVSVV